MPGDDRIAATGGRPPMVRMAGVSKAFDGRTVLDAVDFAVRAGEKVTLIGPSGSGKTTILRLAIGLTKPDAGLIEIDGRYLWHEIRAGQLVDAGERHARGVRRVVGMVFQQFNLFPHMTALQNVRDPTIQVLGLTRDEAESRAVELLTQVGLADHMAKRPAQLSGGQQQRVAIARALALRPKVMLFDEVTSALDPELVGEVLRVIRELAHATDMAMLLVTHEISFAEDIADRVLMFDAGRIVEDGPPAQVLKDPTHPRTRQFLRAIIER
ncbi:MAG: ectoine/hydroxyectoine ABC transporter ATP-binding protein EhuA [Alphaproteobacteria bacterium]|nr:ectoine/hydroxyectoine ABC transporter ATP-binding protein EhuA [Alphaproteobacteria bacterium]